MEQIIADDASSQSGMMQIAAGDGESSNADAMTAMGINSLAPNLKEHASDDTELTVQTKKLTASELMKKNNHMSAQNKSGGAFAFGGMAAGLGGAGADDSSQDLSDMDGKMNMGDNDSESAVSGMMRMGTVNGMMRMGTNLVGDDDDAMSGMMRMGTMKVGDDDDAMSGVMAQDDDDAMSGVMAMDNDDAMSGVMAMDDDDD